MSVPTVLCNDRTLAARSDADVIGRARHWAAALLRRGLVAEAVAMFDIANEVEMLRAALADKRRLR